MNDSKEKALSFNKWLFENDFVPNTSYLWFDCKLSTEVVKFFKLEELYDIFDSGISVAQFVANKAKERNAYFAKITS